MSESLPLCSLQFYSNYPSIFFHKTQHRIMLSWTMGFLDSSDRKESACNSGDPGLIPRQGRTPGEGNGYPLQYCCLENTMQKGAWQAIVHGVAMSWT